MTYNDEENLKLLRATTRGLPYNPATYTCIKEFSDSFLKPATAPFVPDLCISQAAWVLEPPYPRIYTKNYKKSLLTTAIINTL